VDGTAPNLEKTIGQSPALNKFVLEFVVAVRNIGDTKETKVGNCVQILDLFSSCKNLGEGGSDVWNCSSSA